MYLEPAEEVLLLHDALARLLRDHQLRIPMLREALQFHFTESVFKSACRSQFPHKSLSLFFILVMVKDKLTDLWGS